MRLRLALALLVVPGFFAISLQASDKQQSEVPLAQVVQKLNRQSMQDVDTSRLLVELIQREYSTGDADLRWALEKSMHWGDILALAHIQAATGRTFEEMTHQGASKDFAAYAEKAGMNRDKMTRSLATFLKEAERERNTRIFDKLRLARRIPAMPDVGSGFGLFQESLDFRYIDVSRPTKIHTIVAAGSIDLKGGK